MQLPGQPVINKMGGKWAISVQKSGKERPRFRNDNVSEPVS